jgi:hypothetical protein
MICFFHKDHNGPLCSHTTRLNKTTLALLQTSLSCIYSYLIQFGGTFPSLYRISPCVVIYLDIHPLLVGHGCCVSHRVKYFPRWLFAPCSKWRYTVMSNITVAFFCLLHG